MNAWNKIRFWASFSDDEKMQMDRRAFLRGMAVTSAGLLVPGATAFDLGNRVVTGKLKVASVITPDSVRVYRDFDEYHQAVGINDFELISWDYVKKSVTPGANFMVPL